MNILLAISHGAARLAKLRAALVLINRLSSFGIAALDRLQAKADSVQPTANKETQ